jgi:hypothetical protein
VGVGALPAARAQLPRGAAAAALTLRAGPGRPLETATRRTSREASGEPELYSLFFIDMKLRLRPHMTFKMLQPVAKD